MKKIIFLAAVIAVLASCITPPKKKEKVDREIGVELKKFIEECIELVPNARNNTIAMRRLEDTIRARMEKKIGDTLDLIHNYPLKIDEYTEFKPYKIGLSEIDKRNKKYNGKYLITFRSYYANNMATLKRCLTNFKITTIIDGASVEKLKDDETYKIQGIFKGFRFEKDAYVSSPPTVSRKSKVLLYISLGTMILEDVKIEPFVEVK